MTTQGPFTNSPYQPQQNDRFQRPQMPDGQVMNGQAPPNVTPRFLEEEPKRRKRPSSAAGWTLAILVPLVLVLGGYGLAYAFFGKEMPTKIEAGKYVLEMAGGEKVECLLEDPGAGSAFTCASDELKWDNTEGDPVSVFASATDAPEEELLSRLSADNNPLTDESTLTHGKVYELETENGTVSVDMTSDDHIDIREVDATASSDNPDAERTFRITRDAVGQLENDTQQ